jgi:eukaryotic-like serine/threonine-protein kinase
MCQAPDELVGRLLGERYRIIQHLATGGVGYLYVVEDECAAGRVKPCHVAKVLRFEHVENATLRARFAREIGATLRVDDPHVRALLHCGTHPTCTRTGCCTRIGCQAPVCQKCVITPYFVAELLLGFDLADTLKLLRCLAPEEVVKIAVQVAHGLEAAHVAGVIHRDIKPENIFLSRAVDGALHVKLLDFGFSWIDSDPIDVFSGRLTLSRTAVGTPEYIAPEQALGDIGRPAADIYSLGVVLFEMLTGSVPFEGSPEVLVKKHLRDPPPQIDRGSDELQRVVSCALQKDPSNRYESAAAMADALRNTPEGQALSSGIA